MSRLSESPLPTVAADRPVAVARASGVGVGIAYAAVGAIAFSGKAIIVKLGFRYGADAITLIALRMAFALPFFAAMGVVATRRPGVVRLSNRDRLAVAVVGFLGYYLASYLDFLGLQWVGASLERLILYLNPTLVLLIGVAVFGRQASVKQVVALVVGYVGVAVALVHDFQVGGDRVVEGSLLVFGSALSYAVYLVGSGELVKRVGTLRLTAYASCVASLCCIAHFFVTRPAGLLLELPAPVYGLSLLNGTVCTVLPVFAVMAGIERLGASVASQVGMIGPVSTIVLADVFLDERMGPRRSSARCSCWSASSSCPRTARRPVRRRAHRHPSVEEKQHGEERRPHERRHGAGPRDPHRAHRRARGAEAGGRRRPGAGQRRGDDRAPRDRRQLHRHLLSHRRLSGIDADGPRLRGGRRRRRRSVPASSTSPSATASRTGRARSVRMRRVARCRRCRSCACPTRCRSRSAPR